MPNYIDDPVAQLAPLPLFQKSNIQKHTHYSMYIC